MQLGVRRNTVLLRLVVGRKITDNKKMVQKGKNALCAKVHHTCHSPTRTRVLLHAAENSIVVSHPVMDKKKQ